MSNAVSNNSVPCNYGFDVEAEVFYAKSEQELERAEVQYEVGHLYMIKSGTDVLDKYYTTRATYWLKKAAAQGNTDAQADLQKLQEMIETLPELNLHPKTAKEQYQLAEYYENGYKGLAEDPVIAGCWYEKASAQGYPEAKSALDALWKSGKIPSEIGKIPTTPTEMLALSKRYLNGDGVEKDDAKTRYWLEKAEEQHEENNKNTNLYLIAGNSSYDAEDFVMAAKWYKKAAVQGIAEAQYCLASCYVEGEGVDESLEKAVYWFEKAAVQGHVDALSTVGFYYYDSIGVKENKPLSIYYFEKAAEQGDLKAQIALSKIYIEDDLLKNQTKAVKWLQKAAEQGDLESQLALANCYYEGDGVQVNFTKAIQLYREAADQGSSDAQFKLGKCFTFGIGVPENLSEGRSWYEKAATQGHAEAADELGGIYYFGTGVKKDPVKALYWYEKAYEAGQLDAKGHFVYCYYLAGKQEKDSVKAAQWYEKAAELGYGMAEYELGICYETGNGVEKDLEKAEAWMRKAVYHARHGDDTARIALQRIRQQKGPSESEQRSQQNLEKMQEERRQAKEKDALAKRVFTSKAAKFFSAIFLLASAAIALFILLDNHFIRADGIPTLEYIGMSAGYALTLLVGVNLRGRLFVHRILFCWLIPLASVAVFYLHIYPPIPLAVSTLYLLAMPLYAKILLRKLKY